MKDLREKASETDATRFKEVDEGDTFRVENPALYAADEVTPEGDFPVHGDWFSLVNEEGAQNGHLEVPRGLAQEVVRVVDHDDVGFPMLVTIDRAELVDEEWVVEISAEESE